jgi:hypothetical protein
LSDGIHASSRYNQYYKSFETKKMARTAAPANKKTEAPVEKIRLFRNSREATYI